MGGNCYVSDCCNVSAAAAAAAAVAAAASREKIHTCVGVSDLLAHLTYLTFTLTHITLPLHTPFLHLYWKHIT